MQLYFFVRMNLLKQFSFILSGSSSAIDNNIVVSIKSEHVSAHLKTREQSDSVLSTCTILRSFVISSFWHIKKETMFWNQTRHKSICCNINDTGAKCLVTYELGFIVCDQWPYTQLFRQYGIMANLWLTKNKKYNNRVSWVFV